MDKVAVAESRVHSGIITIVNKCDIVCETVELAYLLQREGGTGACDDILRGALRHADDVGLSLDEYHTVIFPYGLLSLVESEELITLMVYLRVGRVDILLHHAVSAGVEHTAIETHHLAAQREPREDDAACETVDELTIVTLIAQSRLDEILLLIARLQRSLAESVTVLRRITEVELLYCVVAEATAAEVLQSDSYTVNIMVQDILKVFQCPLVEKEHRLAVAFLLLLLGRELSLAYLYIVLPSQPPQCLRIGEVLQLHEEVHGVAAFPTGEAMAYTA